MKLHLRYLDSNPNHAQLWPLLDPDFIPIPKKVLSIRQRDSQIDEFFKHSLSNLPHPDLALIIFHIHENKADGSYFQWNPEWVSRWPQERLFFIFVTGGEIEKAQTLIQQLKLPLQHAHALSLLHLSNWSPLQLKAWQNFKWVLYETKAAQWPLLQGKLQGKSWQNRMEQDLYTLGPAQLPTHVLGALRYRYREAKAWDALEVELSMASEIDQRKALWTQWKAQNQEK